MRACRVLGNLALAPGLPTGLRIPPESERALLDWYHIPQIALCIWIKVRRKKGSDCVCSVLQIAGNGQWLPAPGVAAKRGGVAVASDLRQSRHGIDGILALHLDQQVLAVGAHAGVVVPGEFGQMALEFSGVYLGEGCGHGGRTSWARQFATRS